MCLSCSPDDSWLEISPEELDAMMRRAAGYLPQEQVPAVRWPSALTQERHGVCSKYSYLPLTQSSSDQQSESDRGQEVESMVHGMKSFVDQVSSHKGAEFPW